MATVECPWKKLRHHKNCMAYSQMLFIEKDQKYPILRAAMCPVFTPSHFFGSSLINNDQTERKLDLCYLNITKIQIFNFPEKIKYFYKLKKTIYPQIKLLN